MTPELEKRSSPRGRRKKGKRSSSSKRKSFQRLLYHHVFENENGDAKERVEMARVARDCFTDSNTPLFCIKYDLGGGIMAFPLSWICMKRPSLELVESVYKAFPGAISSQDNDAGRILPLHYACRYGASLGVVRYLVKNYPEGIKQADKNGDLPLHYACGIQLAWGRGKREPENIQETASPGGVDPVVEREPSLDVLKYLVAEYPDSVKVQNNDGWLPLHSLCDFRPNLKTAHCLLSEFPGGVSVKTNTDCHPMLLLVVGKCHEKHLPQDVIVLLRYVERKLAHNERGLPTSRFDLEWEIKYRKLLRSKALKSKNTQVIQTGMVAQQESSVLSKLRDVYPSQDYLKRKLAELYAALKAGDALSREQRKQLSLEKRAVAAHLHKEEQDSNTIPRQSFEKIQALETTIKGLDKALNIRSLPLGKRLQVCHKRDNFAIEHFAEKETYVGHVLDHPEQAVDLSCPAPSFKKERTRSTASVATATTATTTSTITTVASSGSRSRTEPHSVRRSGQGGVPRSVNITPPRGYNSVSAPAVQHSVLGLSQDELSPLRTDTMPPSDRVITRNEHLSSPAHAVPRSVHVATPKELHTASTLAVSRSARALPGDEQHSPEADKLPPSENVVPQDNRCAAPVVAVRRSVDVVNPRELDTVTAMSRSAGALPLDEQHSPQADRLRPSDRVIPQEKRSPSPALAVPRSVNVESRKEAASALAAAPSPHALPRDEQRSPQTDRLRPSDHVAQVPQDKHGSASALAVPRSVDAANNHGPRQATHRCAPTRVVSPNKPSPTVSMPRSAGCALKNKGQPQKGTRQPPLPQAQRWRRKDARTIPGPRFEERGRMVWELRCPRHFIL